MSRTAHTRDWLIGRRGPPPVEELRARRLAAHAYTVLPRPHPVRAAVRPDYVSALRRHFDIRHELLPLISAWRAAGIDVLLFKGFHLAEFIYPSPGGRFHGDVDVLIRDARLADAASIARAHGWLEIRPTGAAYAHDPFKLVRVGGATMVDVHRRVVRSWRFHQPKPERVTDAVWEASRRRAWADIEVREPMPVDMLLVALVLSRCWGSEHWQLKPMDYVDFEQLVAHAGVTHSDARARARELRCERTLDIFVRRCDPAERRLDLERPGVWRRALWDVAAIPERGAGFPPESLPHRMWSLPDKLRLALTYLPMVIRVRQTLRRSGDPRAVLVAITTWADRYAAPPPSVPIRHIVEGVRLALRLVGPGAYGFCLVRALSLYAALHRQRWPVVFVSGVRRECDRFTAHAWVEVEGATVPELWEPVDGAPYRENFRFPRRTGATSAVVRARASGYSEGAVAPRM